MPWTERMLFETPESKRNYLRVPRIRIAIKRVRFHRENGSQAVAIGDVLTDRKRNCRNPQVLFSHKTVYI